MCNNLTLCLLLNLLIKNPEKPDFKLPELCLKIEHDAPNINIQVNNITQHGNANIAGNGSAEYSKNFEYKGKIEQLERENKLLSELIEMLKNKSEHH